ncbi:MAG: DUF3570 domain-containing protein [Sandaracinaceae bacterium]|nr:DUF3570 domain-containing protein [Sandaracinaceae bacterium]
MRTLRPSLVFLACVALGVGVFGDDWLGAPLEADESSGTWTGQLAIEGNYYWETSTRVVAPEVNLQLASPDGVQISADYLVDAITSASIAAGVIEDIRFTEVRNQGTITIGREFDLGDAQLRVGAMGRVSHEPDYLATGIGVNATLSLNQRSTVIYGSLGYIHDDVGAILRGMNQMDVDPMGRMLSNRGRVGELEGVNTSLSVQQLILPNLWVSASYDLIYTQGYLANVYRSVMVQGVLTPETHPGSRTRHALSGRIAYFFEPTRTAVHLMYRSYFDDWELGAVNPEVRLYQEIGDSVTLRARYRFYDQTRSFFWRPVEMFTADDPFVTADPKMGAFASHLVGFRLLVQLGFLDATPLSFLSRGYFDLSFDYLWQGSRYGEAVLAQSGLHVPF